MLFDLTCQTAINNACMDVTKTRPLPPTSTAGSAHPSSPVPSQFSRLENCDAVMVALSRTRYAIIHRDDAKRMVPVERICKRIRDLKAGDEVIYNGRRETVHGLCAF